MQQSSQTPLSDLSSVYRPLKARNHGRHGVRFAARAPCGLFFRRVLSSWSRSSGLQEGQLRPIEVVLTQLFCWQGCNSFSVSMILQEDPLYVKVNKLSSIRTQLPYEYYTMPFCKPKGGVEKVAENLGEVLRGDRIESSIYEVRKRHFIFHETMIVILTASTCFLQFKMRVDEQCNFVCRKKLTAEEAQQFKEKIEDEYRVFM